MNFRFLSATVPVCRFVRICTVVVALELFGIVTLHAQISAKHYTISGRVVVHSNPQQGLSNIPVTLTCDGRIVLTDSTGRYVFAHVPQGRWYQITIACTARCPCSGNNHTTTFYTTASSHATHVCGKNSPSTGSIKNQASVAKQ